MPAYMVEIEHRDTDQVFSYYHDNKMLHFNVSLLARLHEKMPAEFRKITMDLNDANYTLCMEHRGIEEPKIQALQPKQLREPGYAVLFGEGLFTIVDGHHRLVRRWRGGVRVMDFWVTDEQVWRACLVEYTAEGEQILADAMPAKVDNPELIASSVAIHPRRVTR